MCASVIARVSKRGGWIRVLLLQRFEFSVVPNFSWGLLEGHLFELSTNSRVELSDAVMLMQYLVECKSIGVSTHFAP